MAGFIPDAAREQIRAASDIVDVIGGYIPLKRAGANFVALCPFHKEKSPSFNVSPQRQMFRCFGCQKSGDVFTFVKEYENIPFVDALRRLAERAKIVLEMDDRPGQTQSRHVKESLLQIHEQITTRWQHALTNEAAGQIARDYLAKRGVKEDAIKLFRLGYAPDLWDDTVNWATSKGFDLPLVEQGGLILHKDSGGFYDRFRGRLMFPICDEQGRVIGFSGRVLSGDEKTAKYVNSPETPIFTKGKVFFGLDKSKRALLDAQCAVVCEGQLDLIACYMAGVQNIVAPQGTALTADHARILKRYVAEAVLCFDSDKAGQNATIRSLDSLLASGVAVRVAVVPAPHDPDSFIKESGGPAFQELIAKAVGFFDYYLNRLCETHDAASDKGRLAILRAMGTAVHKTGDLVLLDKYAQKTALRLGVTPDAVRAEFKKLSLPRHDPVVEALEIEAPSVEETELTPPMVTEQWLLKILFQHEDTVEWIRAHLDLNWIPHPRVREIISARVALAGDDWRSVAAFLDQFESTECLALITEAAIGNRPIPNPAQQAGDIVLRLRNQFLDRLLASTSQRAGQPDVSDTTQLELFREIEALRRLKRQPLEPLVKDDEPF